MTEVQTPWALRVKAEHAARNLALAVRAVCAHPLRVERGQAVWLLRLEAQ